MIVDRVLGVPLATTVGQFRAGAYVFEEAGLRVQVMVIYRRLDSVPCLVRLNSACLTGDILGSRECDCGWQLLRALQIIHDEDSGLVVYDLGEEARGHGLLAKMRALKQKDIDARIRWPGDRRDYLRSIAVLKDLGVRVVCLLTNSPAKTHAVEAAGIRVARTERLWSDDPRLARFQESKIRILGHMP